MKDKNNNSHFIPHAVARDNVSKELGGQYACPMHCEGDKTYVEAGRCPVCKMHLKPLEDHSDKDHHCNCNNGNDHDHPEHQISKKDSHTEEEGDYYCPMHCEGEKTYKEPGECPECGMHLNKKVSGHSSAKISYTCPMHPEIIQDQPGSCPKCGMELVPNKVNDTSEEEKAYKKMAKKFWIALGFSIPVFVIAMSELFSFLHLVDIASKRFWGWIQFLLATPVIFYSSWIFFKRGWSSIRRWSPNMWTLISIGVGAAYLSSVLALLFPDIFPEQFKDELGNTHLYFEAAAVILTLVLLGQVLELRAHSKTNSAIKALLGLVPPIARIIRNGEEVEIPLENVKVGDILRIKPGEKIPVDGIISEGTAIIDESMITGEPIPVDKSKDDKITGGTINGNTSFTMVALSLIHISEPTRPTATSRMPSSA